MGENGTVPNSQKNEKMGRFRIPKKIRRKIWKIGTVPLSHESSQGIWSVYARKNKYAESIKFNDIINLLRDFLDVISIE